MQGGSRIESRCNDARFAAFYTFIFLVICSVPCLCQEPVATIRPGAPRIGDTLRITYNPSAPTALFPNVRELTAEVLILWTDYQQSTLLELPMNKTGERWEISFPLTDSASLILVQFVSGNLIDNGDGEGFHAIVLTNDGRPTKGAHRWLANQWKYGDRGEAGFYHRVDKQHALAEIEQELHYYPDDLEGRIRVLYHRLEADSSRSNIADVSHQADSLFHFSRSSMDTARYVAGVLRRIESSSIADSTLAALELLDAGPGNVRDSIRALLKRAADDSTMYRLLEQCVRDFPADTAGFGYLYIRLRLAHLHAEGKYRECISLFEATSTMDADELTLIAWNLFVANAELEQALAYAVNAVQLARSPDPKKKPGYMRKSEWKERTTRTLVDALHIYGYGLTKLSRHTEALAAFTEALEKSDGMNAYLNERLVRSLLVNDRFDDALRLGSGFIRNGTATDSVAPILKEACARRKDAPDFDRLLDDATRARNVEDEKLIRESCLGLPLPDIDLETLDGTPVSITAFKGKVLVLELWATWCSPCRESLPHLQEFYDSVKQDNRIAVVALDVRESLPKNALLTQVKKFIAEQNYTFPVLISKRGAALAIEGIPTLVIVDKIGRIQFREVGSDALSGDPERVRKRLDLLLSEEFYQ